MREGKFDCEVAVVAAHGARGLMDGETMWALFHRTSGRLKNMVKASGGTESRPQLWAVRLIRPTATIDTMSWLQN